MVQHSDIDHTGVTGVPSGTAPNPTTIELGHASDTTLARVSAGVVSIEGTNIVKAGAATGSGLTMATARLLGRTTASTGAIEEITVGSGLSLSAGALTATGGGGGITRNTVGTTSAGGSFDGTRRIYMKKVTLASAGLLSSINAFVRGNANNTSAITAAIYADSAGTPTNVIALGGPIQKESDNTSNTHAVLSTTARAVSVAMGRWLTAADYWLAVCLHAAADSRIDIAYTASTGSDRTKTGSTFHDESVTGGSATTSDFSIYADILT